MASADFPEGIRRLPSFDGPFDAHRLRAEGCEVLFASYPAGTDIPTHRHATDNWGVITAGELILTRGDVVTRHGPGDWYHVAPQEAHAAHFEVPTAEIEFWFGPESLN